MTFWLIAVPTVVALGALVWWSSGRAKPDLRRRSIAAELTIREGRAGMHGAGFPDGGGPSPSGF